MSRSLYLHELLTRLNSLSRSQLNYPIKVTRHEGWTEIRVYGKLKSPFFRALPIKRNE